MTIDHILELKKCCDPKHGAAFFISNYIRPLHKHNVTLWNNQHQFLSDMSCARDLVYLKARHTGFTTISTYYILWKLMFDNFHNIVIITDNYMIGSSIINCLLKCYNSLPDWMKTYIPIDRCDTHKITIRDNTLLHCTYNGYDRFSRGIYFDTVILEEATTLSLSEYDLIWRNTKMRNGKAGNSKVIMSMGMPTTDLKNLIIDPPITHFVRHWDWWMNPNHSISDYMRLKSELPIWLFESEIAV